MSRWSKPQRTSWGVFFCAPTGAVACLLAAHPASAEELESARLTYSVSAPDACPDVDSFRQQVAARLGYQPFRADGTHRVSVVLRVEGQRVRGRAEVVRKGQASPGVRELQSDVGKCEALVSALAATVAIAIDPTRDGSSAPPPPPSAASRAPAPTDAPPPPATSTSTDSLPSRSFFVTAAVPFRFGAAPGPTLGADVGIGVRLGSFALEAGGGLHSMWTPARVDLGYRVETTVFYGTLSPCTLLGNWAGCLVGRFGSFQGRAPDATVASLRSSPYATLGIRAGYTLPISSFFALRGLAMAEFPLVRTSLVVDGRTIWTAPPAMVGGEIGAIFSLF